MTFHDYITNELRRYLTADEAQAVIAAYKANPAHEDMKEWNEQTHDYPSTMLAIVWMGIKNEALTWIDANNPLAWYRPMFLSESERQALFADAGITVP